MEELKHKWIFASDGSAECEECGCVNEPVVKWLPEFRKYKQRPEIHYRHYCSTQYLWKEPECDVGKLKNVQ